MRNVAMIAVISKSIKAIGYGDEDSALYVEFRHGGMYRYEDVPGLVYRRFLTASSKGRFFLDNVRDMYPHERLHDSA